MSKESSNHHWLAFQEYIPSLYQFNLLYLRLHQLHKLQTKFLNRVISSELILEFHEIDTMSFQLYLKVNYQLRLLLYSQHSCSQEFVNYKHLNLTKYLFQRILHLHKQHCINISLLFHLYLN